MATIQTTMQFVDRVTPVLDAITNALTATTKSFENLQRVFNIGLTIGNIQTTANNFNNIASNIISTQQVFEQARATMQIPIQPTITTPTIPQMPVINSNVQVPAIPSQIVQNSAIQSPVWQSGNNMQIFNTAGIERYNQELTSAQSMANRLASTQASISIQSANTRLFPQNMNTDMNNIYQRVLRISQVITRLSQQRVDPAGAGQLSNTLETLRRHLNSAISEQNTLNTAMRNMNISGANDAYQRLVNNINSAEVHIRNNITAQNSFNNSIQQGAENASSLLDKLKSFAGAYISIMGLKQGIQNTVGAAMQLNQQQQTLNTMFGNADVGTAYFKQLQQYALDTGQNMTDLTAATKRYIGYTKNTNKLMEFNKIAQKMAVYDPVQGVQGAAYALNEALSGSFTSLKLRFEMSSADIQPLKDAVKQGNLDQVQETLNALMASKQITDEVLDSFQNTATFKFNKLINNFKSKLAQAGEASINVVEPMIDKVSNWLNSSDGMTIITGISNAAYMLMSVLDIVISKSMLVSSFIADNWSIIAPIILGVVGAMVAFNAMTFIANTLSNISKAIELGCAIAKAIHTRATLASASATAAATAEQWKLNAAMLTCPITWIIMIIIALIAVIYAVVGAINTFTGQSISATGIIMGSFTVAGATIINIIIGVYNLIVGVVVDIWNLFAAFAEFFANFLNDPIGSICRLFISLADFVLGILESIGSGIDAIFGSNLAGAVSGWRNSMQSWTDENIQQPKYKIDRVDKTSLQLDRINYGDAWNTGYNFGAGIEESFKIPNFDNLMPTTDPNILNDWNSEQTDTLNSIDDNGKSIKNKMDDLEDDLVYLRDMAEIEAINRFTTAEIRVTMNNSNNINSSLDLDGITSSLTDKIYEQMQVAAEGVYI